MFGKFWLYRRLRAAAVVTDYFCLQLASGVVYSRLRLVGWGGVIVDLPNGSTLCLPWASVHDFSHGPAVKDVFVQIEQQVAQARAGRAVLSRGDAVLAEMPVAGSA